jgi:hypothetical protein
MATLKGSANCSDQEKGTVDNPCGAGDEERIEIKIAFFSYRFL